MQNKKKTGLLSQEKRAREKKQVKYQTKEKRQVKTRKEKERKN